MSGLEVVTVEEHEALKADIEALKGKLKQSENQALKAGARLTETREKVKFHKEQRRLVLEMLGAQDEIEGLRHALEAEKVKGAEARALLYGEVKAIKADLANARAELAHFAAQRGSVVDG